MWVSITGPLCFPSLLKLPSPLGQHSRITNPPRTNAYRSKILPRYVYGLIRHTPNSSPRQLFRNWIVHCRDFGNTQTAEYTVRIYIKLPAGFSVYVLLPFSMGISLTTSQSAYTHVQPLALTKPYGQPSCWLLHPRSSLLNNETNLPLVFMVLQAWQKATHVMFLSTVHAVMCFEAFQHLQSCLKFRAQRKHPSSNEIYF